MRNEYVSFLFLLPELISTHARAFPLLPPLNSRPRWFFFLSLSLSFSLSFFLSLFSLVARCEYSSFSLSLSLDLNSRSNGISRRGGREKTKRKQEKGWREEGKSVPWMYSRCDVHLSETTAVRCWKVDRASYRRGQYSRSAVYLHK